MYLNTNISISLSGYSSRFNEICRLILVQIITTLNCGNFLHRLDVYLLMHLLSRSAIYRFLSSTHWFIVKFSTLFLKLIITNIKRISSHAMISHPHLILLIKMLLHIILLFHYVILVIICTYGTILSKYWGFSLFTSHTTLPMIPITITSTISIIVIIHTMRILRRLTILRCLIIFRTWSRLHICDIHITSTEIISWISRSMHLSGQLTWIVNIILLIIRLMWVNMIFLSFLNLSRLKTTPLIFLINLIRLFLRTSVKITTSYSKFFHLNLRIYGVIIMRFLWMIFVTRIPIFLNRFNSTFLTRWTLRIYSIWINLRR